jgi:DNA-directed RNA polymerase specialized sigma24 family protein
VTALLTDDEAAWVVREYIRGRRQTAIAAEVAISVPTVSYTITRFCRRWGNVDVIRRQLYDDRRRRVAVVALERYGRKPQRPRLDDFAMTLYQSARKEHAWLLHAEGLAYKEIAYRFGVTLEAARQMSLRFGRRVERAMRRTRWEKLS